MTAISRLLVKADDFSDYIPVLSTATNLVNIFQKCVILPCMTQRFITTSPYYHHLNQKSVIECALSAIPFAKVIVCMLDTPEGGSSGVGSDYGGSYTSLEQEATRLDSAIATAQYQHYSGSHCTADEKTMGYCFAPLNPFDCYTKCSASDQ